MTKQLIAFDLDDTLAITKSPISDEMGELLVKLLDYYDVCVISGARFEQIRSQVVDRLEASARQLTRLHIMPTCGTRYYRYDELDERWKKQYVNDLTTEQKSRIKTALEDSAKQLNLWPKTPYGEVIEDRLSQMTFSALGQQAPPEEKYAWDPDGKKKMAIRDLVAPIVPELEVRVGGTTSVDVTLIGVDKAYGMKKLLEEMKIAKENILFIGDKLQEGGNDYPVKAMGIDTIEVERWEDTAFVLEGILAVSK